MYAWNILHFKVNYKELFDVLNPKSRNKFSKIHVTEISSHVFDGYGIGYARDDGMFDKEEKYSVQKSRSKIFHKVSFDFVQ